MTASSAQAPQSETGSPRAADFAGRRALVFDSGMGGLTVARALAAQAPGLAVDYSADTGFFPYGDKPDAALAERVPLVAAALAAASRADVLVMACNTASTLALEATRARLGIPVVGTVPAIKPAARLSRSGVVGLLATPGTIRRPYTDRLIAEHAGAATVLRRGSSVLVELAEAHSRGEVTDPALYAAEIAPLFEGEAGARLDTIVLACTHFPLVAEQIAAAAPRPVRLVDPSDAIARQTLKVLGDLQRARSGWQHGVRAAGGRAFITSPLESQAPLLGVLSRFGFAAAAYVPVPTEASASSTSAEAGAASGPNGSSANSASS